MRVLVVHLHFKGLPSKSQQQHSYISLLHYVIVYTGGIHRDNTVFAIENNKIVCNFTVCSFRVLLLVNIMCVLLVFIIFIEKLNQ